MPRALYAHVAQIEDLLGIDSLSYRSPALDVGEIEPLECLQADEANHVGVVHVQAHSGQIAFDAIGA